MVISGSGNFSSHNRNVKFSNYDVIDQVGKTSVAFTFLVLACQLRWGRDRRVDFPPPYFSSQFPTPPYFLRQILPPP